MRLLKFTLAGRWSLISGLRRQTVGSIGNTFLKNTSPVAGILRNGAFSRAIGACRMGIEILPSRVPGDFGCRRGSQFRMVVLVQGARTTGLLVERFCGAVTLSLAKLWFCEGPPARRPVLEPTPTPERPSLTVVRQEQILGCADSGAQRTGLFEAKPRERGWLDGILVSRSLAAVFRIGRVKILYSGSCPHFLLTNFRPHSNSAPTFCHFLLSPVSTSPRSVHTSPPLSLYCEKTVVQNSCIAAMGTAMLSVPGWPKWKSWLIGSGHPRLTILVNRYGEKKTSTRFLLKPPGSGRLRKTRQADRPPGHQRAEAWRATLGP